MYLFRYRFQILVGLLSLCIFIYLIIRAIYVPILHDEVATFLIYIKSGNFLPHTAWLDANNHIFNSFAVHKMYEWFGPSPFSLRFPNVLSWLLFSISVVGISRSLKDEFFKYGFICIMFLSHGFIEFFAFTRGYGISMAFLMFSVWMLLEMHRKSSGLFAGFVLLTLIPAFLSNLTLLPSSLMIAVYSSVLFVRKIKKYHVLSVIFYLVSFLFFLIIFLYFLDYSLKLRSMNLLYYGGEEGFFNAIIKTHAQMLFNSISPLLLWSIVGFFILILILYLNMFFRIGYKRIFEPCVTFFPYIFLSSIIVILLMHFAMDVNYPEDRTSLFLYPYFIGFIFFASDLLQFKGRKWILLPLILIPMNFIFHLNSSFSFQWYFERIHPKFIEIVAANSGDKSPSNVTISGYKIHELIWGFHVASMNSNVNLINPGTYPNNMDDFILLRKEEADSMLGYFDDYEILAVDKYSDVRLLKRREFLQRNFLFQKTPISGAYVSDNEFIEFFPDTVFDFFKKSLVFEFDIQFEEGFSAEGCVLVVSLRDSENNTLKYQRLETAWMSHKPISNLNYSLSVLHIPCNTAGMVVYIWNKHKRVLRIKHASVKVYEFGKF